MSTLKKKRTIEQQEVEIRRLRKLVSANLQSSQSLKRNSIKLTPRENDDQETSFSPSKYQAIEDSSPSK